MSRRIQMQIPTVYGAWPVVRYNNGKTGWITIAEIRTCHKPQVGWFFFHVLFDFVSRPAPGEPPTYSEVIAHGTGFSLGGYKNARARGGILARLYKCSLNAATKKRGRIMATEENKRQAVNVARISVEPTKSSDPIMACAGLAEPAPDLCFECGRELRGIESGLGVCRTCFGQGGRR